MSAFNIFNTAVSNPSNPVNPQPATDKTRFWQEYIAQRRPEVQELKKALDAGDLSAAQQAYNNLVALGNQVLHRDNPFLRQDRALDFNAIGGALQNGDLDGARQAFAALHDTFQRKLPPVLTASPSPKVANQPGKVQEALSSVSATEDGQVSGNGVDLIA